MKRPPFELVSHPLCPFLGRALIVLEHKGAVAGADYAVRHVALGTAPSWFELLSPKRKMPLVHTPRGDVFFDTDAMLMFVDEVSPGRLGAATPLGRLREQEQIRHASLLLDTLRRIFVSADRDELTAARIDFMTQLGVVEFWQHDPAGPYTLVDAALAPMFQLAWHFDVLRADPGWAGLPSVVARGNRLLQWDAARTARCADFEKELARFFDLVGGAFRERSVAHAA